jgi:hypothetical protein
MSVV